MAIDFLIFCLLLVSFGINLLALGAFWVTPGLRTTANRFTINLLIINLVGCLILAPTLFLSGSDAPASASSPASLLAAQMSNDSIEYLSKAGNHQMTIRHNGQLVEQEGIILRRNVTTMDGEHSQPRTIKTIFKGNSTFYQEFTIDEGADTIVITEIEEEKPLGGIEPSPPSFPSDMASPMPHFPVPNVTMRCWSIDMAAALGALAVLLIVGDTWCAVTDPLRYHSRISGVKSWVFIALTWALGILFGALSAFRVLDFESETTILSKDGHALGESSYNTETLFYLSSSNIVFGMIFACLYFVVIILLPFGFVCGMYWRIFSEARENGLRMRQNGSSPLLQSALNLTHHQQQHQQHQQQQQQHQQQQHQHHQHHQSSSSSSALQYSNSLCVHRNSVSSASSLGGTISATTGGLTMQIDHQQQPQQQQHRKSSPACLRRDSTAKVLLPTISDDGMSDELDSEHAGNLLSPTVHHNQADRNQNILLTLQSASGEIKRNYSARQLPILGTSSQDLHETERLQGIRQVQSSPNLQKYTQLRQDSLSDDNCSPHLLGHRQVQHHANHNQPQRQHARHSQHVQHTHALQIPAIHASPKTLSYMSSLRHRLSNASSLFKYREESRAARISILVVIMFLVSYLPYGCLVLLQSRLAAANFPHSTQLAIFMIVLANLSSPFIFAYRNKRVRRGVKRLLGCQTRHERTLKRQNSSSGRGSGFINRHSSASTKLGTSTAKHTTASKVPTAAYSPSNSCKYLTPQSSLVSNGNGCPTTISIHANGVGITNPSTVGYPCANTRFNDNCDTIITFGLSTPKSAHSVCGNESDSELLAQQNARQLRRPRPVLQRGITIVEQIPLSSKLAAKRTLFRMFFQSTRNLNCAQGDRVDCSAFAPTEV